MKKDCKNFIKLLFFVKIMMNNFQNVIIELFFHEIFYKFKMLKTVNLLNNDQTQKRVENKNLFTAMKNKKKCFEKKFLTQSALLKQCRKLATTRNTKN